MRRLLAWGGTALFVVAWIVAMAIGGVIGRESVRSVDRTPTVNPQRQALCQDALLRRRQAEQMLMESPVLPRTSDFDDYINARKATLDRRVEASIVISRTQAAIAQYCE